MEFKDFIGRLDQNAIYSMGKSTGFLGTKTYLSIDKQGKWSVKELGPLGRVCRYLFGAYANTHFSTVVAQINTEARVFVALHKGAGDEPIRLRQSDEINMQPLTKFNHLFARIENIAGEAVLKNTAPAVIDARKVSSQVIYDLAFGKFPVSNMKLMWTAKTYEWHLRDAPYHTGMFHVFEAIRGGLGKKLDLDGLIDLHNIYHDEACRYYAQAFYGQELRFGKHRDLIQEEANQCITSYYKVIHSARNDDEKLIAIATVCQKLLSLAYNQPEIMASAVLTKLLIENGLSPAILKNPAGGFGECQTLDERVAAIKAGMEAFKSAR